MAANATPPDIVITLRHMERDARLHEYALEKLEPLIRSLPNLRTASVEITLERTRPVEGQHVVQVTLAADGVQVRAEERGRTPYSAVDQAHDLLERRIRDWKTRAYFQRRQESAAQKEAEAAQAAALPPEDKSGWIVRRKSHETKPLTPEEAIDQMETLGHDFFLFINAETGAHNVVYRRRAGGYGLIEPAIASADVPQFRESGDERRA